MREKLKVTTAQLKHRLLERYPKSRFTPLPGDKADALRARYPGVPEDYVQFLTEIGYGRIGGGRLSVYSGPVEADDIYDEQTAAALAGVLLVGDDFTGYCVGYATGLGWVWGGVDDACTFSPMEGIGTFVAFIEYWCFGPDSP
ncbi:MAG TPA: hypothetical protein VF796_29585 [Humisphaera sp.]